MVLLGAWFENNWFNIIQTVGIIGSLWLATAGANREAKAQEIGNILTLSDHHRELWRWVSERQELHRIFQTNVKAPVNSITVAEEEFINLVIVHFQTGWRISKAGGITTLTELATDVRSFCSLPLPRAVWDKTKMFRNQKFVKFVQASLDSYQVKCPH